jgi:4-oxalocrotonate tautomerase
MAVSCPQYFSTPFINVRTAKGDAGRLTEVLVEVEGRGNAAFRSLVVVLIEEEEPTNWSLGGMQVTAEQLEALIGAPHAS